MSKYVENKQCHVETCRKRQCRAKKCRKNIENAWRKAYVRTRSHFGSSHLKQIVTRSTNDVSVKMATQNPVTTAVTAAATAVTAVATAVTAVATAVTAVATTVTAVATAITAISNRL